MSTLKISIPHFTGGSNQFTKTRKIKGLKIKKKKNCLYLDNITTYLENPKESRK